MDRDSPRTQGPFIHRRAQPAPQSRFGFAQINVGQAPRPQAVGEGTAGKEAGAWFAVPGVLHEG